MSAADRMAVRMPGGEIRSVPRRVGLAMVARSQATHAPQQSATRPAAKGHRPAPAARYTPEMFEGTAVADYSTDEPHPDRIDLTPDHDVSAQTSGIVDLADPEHGPVIDPAEFFEEDDPTPAPASVAFAVAPKGNASRDAWAKYAGFRGVPVTDQMGRNEIRAAVAELALDRMSRPAREGGRPATPEDEPVTEDMVTSADPGERTA